MVFIIAANIIINIRDESKEPILHGDLRFVVVEERFKN
jgi:hypothetical protein